MPSPIKSVPENEAVVTWLVDAMKALPVGGVLAWEQLNEIAGCDVRGEKSYLRRRARDILRKEHHILIDTATGVGVKRLPDNGASGYCERKLGTVRRAAREAIEGAACVTDFNALSPEEKAKILSAQSRAGAMYLLSGKKAADQIAAAASVQRKELTFTEVVDAMKSTLKEHKE